MKVELYVYDLSKGLARQYSASFLGTYIDAVYHTAIVFDGVEYLYGAGVQTCIPGSSHHGRPMEVIDLGATSLPQDVIAEYLASLKEIYTVESYDLFLHNCNNFSNDFATFLVGKGIPKHITSLPQTVLNTPFGQMLKPQLDQAMRSVTQAPLPSSSAPPVRATPSQSRNGIPTSGFRGSRRTDPKRGFAGRVHNVTSLPDLDRLLESASRSCAVIFFTSSTCPPCRLVYPAYDALAEEAGKDGILIKVDIGQAYAIGQRYGVRATPTFMSLLHGEKENEWAGADPSKLLGNVRLLLQMAKHPHQSLELPILRSTSQKPVTFANIPPLERLISKMGPTIGEDAAIQSLKHFVTARTSEGAKEATLPDMAALTSFLQATTTSLPPSTLFPVVDLLRVAIVDPRFSGYLAEEVDHKTTSLLLKTVNSTSPTDDTAYPLRLVTLQAACNLFSTQLYPHQLVTDPVLSSEIINLTTSSLLDDHPKHAPVRVAASSLAFNIAVFVYKQRAEGSDETLSSGLQVELFASLLEAIAAEEESESALGGLLLAVGFLVREVETDGEVWETCKVIDASKTVLSKGESKLGKAKEGLVREVGEALLGASK